MIIPATIICILTIALLLIRDSRHGASMSAATWIPTSMVFTLSSRNPGELLGGGAPVNEVYCVLLFAASIIVLYSRSIRWHKLLVNNAPLILFYVYFAVSSLWSATPYDSLIRITRDFGSTVLIVLVLFSEKHPYAAIRAVYIRCACIAFPWTLLLTRYYSMGKSFGRDGTLMFNGPTQQKNSLGDMLIVLMLFLVSGLLASQATSRWADRSWKRMRMDWLALFLIGAWLLYLSQSKTSLVCLLIGLGVMFAPPWASFRKIGWITVLAALSLPFLLLLTQAFSSATAPILDALGRDATFTGRDQLWQKVISAKVDPIIGTGFWNFWGTPGGIAIARALDPDSEGLVPSAHNGYLDIYLDGGLLGLLVLSILLLTSAKRIIHNLPQNGFHQLRFAFLLVAIVANLTESFLARPSPLWFTTVLILIDYPFQRTAATQLKPAWTGRRHIAETASQAVQLTASVRVTTRRNELTSLESPNNCGDAARGSGDGTSRLHVTPTRVEA